MKLPSGVKLHNVTTGKTSSAGASVEICGGTKFYLSAPLTQAVDVKGEWNKIKVPSCWEMEGYGTFNYGHDKPKADESGLYKTTFEVPATWKGKRIFIVFEGSMTDTEIKVNGSGSFVF